MTRLYVREAVINYRPTKLPVTVIRSSADAVTYFEDIRLRTTEHFQVLALDAKNRVVAQYTLSKGTTTYTVVDLKDLFRFAILANAVGIILGHNHPSGSHEPSADDITLTHKIVETGTMLDIKVLDHLILGDEGYVSLADLGCMRP